MPSRRRLTLASFEDFAKKNFLKVFEKFENMDEYTFERKKAAGGYPSARTEMLLVGRYHTQNATLPNVWANNTESGINYYVGLVGTLLVKLAPDPARIYFKDEPFNLVIGGKNDQVLYTAHDARRGCIPSINKWGDVVESVITFLFLKTGRLKYAYVTDVNAVLDNFRVACMHFSKNTRPRSDDYHIKRASLDPEISSESFDSDISSESSDTDFSSESFDPDLPSDISSSETSHGTGRYNKPYGSSKIKIEYDASEDDWDCEYDSDPHCKNNNRYPRRDRVAAGKNTKSIALPDSRKSRRSSKSEVTIKTEYDNDSAMITHSDHELQVLREGLKQEKQKVQNLKTDLIHEQRKHRAADSTKVVKDYKLRGRQTHEVAKRKQEVEARRQYMYADRTFLGMLRKSDHQYLDHWV